MAVEHVNLGSHGSFGVHKGALHRALGVAEGRKIPTSKLASGAASSDPHVRRMVASAKGFAGMHHGGAKKHSFGGPPVD